MESFRNKAEEMEKGRKIIGASLLSGLVTLFSCIAPLSSWWKGNAAWGLTVGILTVLSSLFLLHKYDDINIQMMKLYGAFMFILWATVAGVLTFDGPFLQTGNGYFATWAGFLAAIFFANHQFSREEEIV